MTVSWTFLVFDDFDSFEELWSCFVGWCPSTGTYLMFFSLLDWNYEFGQDDHKDRVSFSYIVSRIPTST